jgi:hypothetical protein
MIAYDCNGKILNVGDEAIKISTEKHIRDSKFIGKIVTVIGPLKYCDGLNIRNPGYAVEIKYHDGSAHNHITSRSLTHPSRLMKITPDADIKEDEDQLVLVDR